MYDTKEKKGEEAPISGQGDISAAEFESPDRLLVAHHLKRVSGFDVDDWKPREHWTPVMTVSERVYRYFLSPLHRIFPKPSELDETAAYLLTDQETLAMTHRRDDLSQARIQLEIWNPVWSNLAFVTAVLLAGSIYVHRRDF
jgi:hypothetical protein